MTDIDTTIPDFLNRKLTQAERDAAWAATPNKPVPTRSDSIQLPTADEITAQRYAFFKERKREKSRGRVKTMLAVMSDREAVRQGKVWDAVNGGWR